MFGFTVTIFLSIDLKICNFHTSLNFLIQILAILYYKISGYFSS